MSELKSSKDDNDVVRMEFDFVRWVEWLFSSCNMLSSCLSTAYMLYIAVNSRKGIALHSIGLQFVTTMHDSIVASELLRFFWKLLQELSTLHSTMNSNLSSKFP